MYSKPADQKNFIAMLSKNFFFVPKKNKQKPKPIIVGCATRSWSVLKGNQCFVHYSTAYPTFDFEKRKSQLKNINLFVGSWEDKHFFSFISDKIFSVKKQKKPIKNQRNKGLCPKPIDEKLCLYQNQNVWMVRISYTMIQNWRSPTKLKITNTCLY